MCRHETRNQNRHADPERTATDTKKLLKIALYDTRPFGEISAECFGEFPRCHGLSFGLRKVNRDFDQLVGGQFAGPTDYIFLCLSIEISFPKWERVKSVQKLGAVVMTWQVRSRTTLRATGSI